jgi:outer membrane protein OmpA-like peptidoglycan-associated protein
LIGAVAAAATLIPVSWLEAQSRKAYGLLAPVNSSYQELAPVISESGATLFFCRQGDPLNTGYQHRKHDQDIWLSRRGSDGKYQKPEHLVAPFNTLGYDYPVAYFEQNNLLYLGNAYNADGSSYPGISRSIWKDGKFSVPENLKIDDFYNEIGLANYAVAPDQSAIILSLQRKDTIGKSDLYVSLAKADGTWGAPRNLGPDVNSSTFEITPFLAHDMHTLYFSSNRAGGAGSFDIYMSRRLAADFSRWSKPRRLGPEINTPRSDIGLVVRADGKSGIYSMESAPGNKDLAEINLPPQFRPLQMLQASGRVVDIDGKPVAARVVFERQSTPASHAETTSSLPDGAFSQNLLSGYRYEIRAERENYAPGIVQINLENSEKPLRNLRLALIPLQTGQKVRLNNVFFASNSAELTSASYAELDRLVLLMRANPTMKIEIGGHTDNIGSSGANLRLSGRRARAVMKYLVSRKIAANRVAARGYGATKPVTANSTEKGRRLNRRVEFSILGL